MAAKAAFLLASYELRVSEDWVVGTTGGPQLSKNSTLRKGEGDNGRLKRNCYFERRPHFFEEPRA
jgi:hypothetical protein